MTRTTTVLGLDLGDVTERAAEHRLAELAVDGVEWACTHRVVVTGVARVAGSIAGEFAVTAEDSCPAAAAAFRDRAEGRAVVFPGSATLTGDVSFAAVLATAVDAIRVLGGGPPPAPDAVLRTRDFVRPRFENGLLTLHVQPARGGVYVPFETPTPTPCCADHA